MSSAFGSSKGWQSRGVVLLAIGMLSTLAYLPSLALPFISDDYLQIDLARQYGPPSGWRSLFEDALYRCRATSLLLTFWTDRAFGLNPLAYNISSLLLHIANASLVFALGSWPLIGWRVAAFAACFFAVYEGHQEAVIWYAALPELLVFFFSLAAVHCWLHWLRSQSAAAWAATLICFLLALASKESGVVVVPLLAVIAAVHRHPWQRIVKATAPFAMLSAVYFAAAFSSRADHLHFNDGTFSLQAPFWIPWTRTYFRLFWFWGLLALGVLWRYREHAIRPVLALSGIWIAVTLMPYSFLTYMPRIPSRHTYLASVGVALVVALALRAISLRLQPSCYWIPQALGIAIVLHNCGYLWAVKNEKYRERAEPTERLLRQVEKGTGPLSLECFPYTLEIAHSTLRTTGHQADIPRLIPRQGDGSNCKSNAQIASAAE